MVLKRHSATIRSIAFSPDGRTLASGSYDKTIKLWDMKTGETTHVIKGHTDRVWRVCFSPRRATIGKLSELGRNYTALGFK